VSIELGGKDTNQLDAVLDNDKGINLIVYMSFISKSLTCAKNYPMCSYVVLKSSQVNFTKSGTLKPQG
jgi:hypothetical protein